MGNGWKVGEMGNARGSPGGVGRVSRADNRVGQTDGMPLSLGMYRKL